MKMYATRPRSSILVAAFVLVGLLFGALTGGCSGGGDNGYVVRMATLFNSDHHLAKKLEWMKKELESRSGGRFTCQVFVGGSLGGEKENLEDLRLGNLEVMNGAGSYFYLYCPELSVLELPAYGWKDREEAHKTLTSYWDKFSEVASKEGYYPVALDIRDYWGIFSREPVNAVDAVKNAKFRSVNAELWIELTKVCGAVPNPIAYADAYMAFKTGVCDGSLGSVTGAASANWHEVLKGYMDARLVLSESFTLASKKWVDGLPEDLRKIFLEVSKESEQFNLQEVKVQYEQNRKKLLDAGVTWVNYEDLDLTALQPKIRAFRDRFMKAKGDKVYKFYQDWLVHVEKVTGRPQS